MIQKILFVVLSAISLSVNGQSFNYKADIEHVNENGFYKILLSPEITSKLNSQFFDIRLFDTNNTEVPYILNREQSVNERELFVEYDIIEKKHLWYVGVTRIIIRNREKTEINNIVLRIKNADVRKKLKLNGSNDYKNWYVIKSDYDYNSISSNVNTSEIRVLNFPLSNYEYYELLIDDYSDRPIDIIQAGYYDLVTENGKYTELENIAFTVLDTLKETIITVPVHGNYIDKISFEIDAPNYYYRQAEMYVKRTRKLKKRESSYNESIANFKLISNSGNTFHFDNLNEDTICIRIKNNDDSSLKISNINLYQLNKYITAELDTQNMYCLKFSDKNTGKPNYDLKYFTDNIPDNLKVISTKLPEKISKTDELGGRGNFNIRNYWLWISIILIAVLLSYMSFTMIRENKN